MLVAREEAQAAITNLNLSERQGKEAQTLTRSLTRTQGSTTENHPKQEPRSNNVR